MAESIDKRGELDVSDDTLVECAEQNSFGSDDPSRTMIRPSVLHLLMWTTFSAVYLATMRALYSGDTGIIEQDLQGFNMVQSVIVGALCTGTVLLLFERCRRGPPAMRQPGHWLLFVPTVTACASLAFFALVSSFDDESFQSDHEWLYSSLAMIFALGPVLYVWAAVSQRCRIWRVLFIGFAIAGVSQCIGFAIIGLNLMAMSSYTMVFFLLAQWCPRILGLSVLIWGIVERVGESRRDWLHWAGVVTLVASTATEILTSVLTRIAN